MVQPGSADSELDLLLEEFELAASNELHGAFACQDFIGGLARYDAAKRDAQLTFARYTNSPESVRLFGRIDEVIRDKAEHEGLQEALKASKELTAEHLAASCLDSLAALGELVEAAKAKLLEHSRSAETVSAAVRTE